MTPKLREAANNINELAKKEEDAQLRLCRAIAAAQELVKKESNLPWRDWADKYLRRPDGSKWSSWTLYKYASYGRNPEKLTYVREAIAQHGKSARKALNAARTAVATDPHKSSQNEIDRQLEVLMFAWRGAGAEARKRFLESIAEARAA